MWRWEHRVGVAFVATVTCERRVVDKSRGLFARLQDSERAGLRRV